MSEQNSLRLDDQLCFALYAASRAVTQTYQPHLQALGLTYPQYLVMLVMWEYSEPVGVAIKSIGEKLMLDTGTLTPLLKRLESAGLLTRQRDAADERVVRIRLTQAGEGLKAQAEAMRAGMVCEYAHLLSGSAELRETLQGLLHTLRSQSAASASGQ